ncbi:MAG TPA: hypothetical protein VLV78_21300 [Thermoanaerobaculia bacterium]|nr:hypothetical protein [Thermoanaerobaculia bacterium]
MSSLIESLFSLAPEIRYVATYLDGVHLSAQRPGLDGASSSESDKYEELIVNPTLLKLVTQRGNIDCGGAKWVIIRYGNFYELVVPVSKGHVSVGIEPAGNPLAIAEQVHVFVERSLS